MIIIKFKLRRYFYVIISALLMLLLLRYSLRSRFSSFTHPLHFPISKTLPLKDGYESYDEYGCGCPRIGPKVNISEEDKETFCSSWSRSRGGGQRVVSYTIYGNHKDFRKMIKYYTKVETRVKDVSQYYPGWIVRLYHNTHQENNYTQALLCSLYCKYHHFDPCLIRNLFIPKFWHMENSSMKFQYRDKDKKKRRPEKRPRFMDHLWNRKMWRYLPMGDPLVSVFLSRDLDSYTLPREMAAVKQWLNNSTAAFHTMRDHPAHDAPMLGGLWGGSRDRDGDMLTRSLRAIVQKPENTKDDYDQIVLNTDVWPIIKKNVLAHHCRRHGENSTSVLPFPTKRQGNFFFLGWGSARNTKELKMVAATPCPVECRPKQHKDWLYC